MHNSLAIPCANILQTLAYVPKLSVSRNRRRKDGEDRCDQFAVEQNKLKVGRTKAINKPSECLINPPSQHHIGMGCICEGVSHQIESIKDLVNQLASLTSKATLTLVAFGLAFHHVLAHILLAVALASLPFDLQASLLTNVKDLIESNLKKEYRYDKIGYQYSLAAADDSSSFIDQIHPHKPRHEKDTLLSFSIDGKTEIVAIGSIGPAEHGATSTHTVFVSKYLDQNLLFDKKYTITVDCEDFLGCDFELGKQTIDTINYNWATTTPNKTQFISKILASHYAFGDYPYAGHIHIKDEYITNSVYLNTGEVKEMFLLLSDFIGFINDAASIGQLVNSIAKKSVIEIISNIRDIIYNWVSSLAKSKDLSTNLVTIIAMGLVSALTAGALAAAAGSKALIATIISIATMFLSIFSATLLAWAEDPPDFNYTEIVEPPISTLPEVKLGESSLDYQLEGLLYHSSLSYIYTGAALDSFEKYQGALIDEIIHGINTKDYQQLHIDSMLYYINIADQHLNDAIMFSDALLVQDVVASEHTLYDAVLLLSNAFKGIPIQNEAPEPSVIPLLCTGLFLMFIFGLLSTKSSGMHGPGQIMYYQTRSQTGTGLGLALTHPHCPSQSYARGAYASR